LSVLPHEGTHAVIYGSLAVPVGSHYRRGFLARPDRAGRFPVVVLAPGLGGVGSHARSMAHRLARRGFAVLAVDFAAHRPATADEALVAYQALTDGEAMRTLDETRRFVTNPDVDWARPETAGILGLDVGGRFALVTAAHRAWVGAAAVVATPLTGDEERDRPVAATLGHLAVPVLGLYGAADDLIAPETVDEAQRRNPTGTWLLYEGARHGFLDETGPDFDPAAAADAVMRLAEFFGRHLPAAETEDQPVLA
jgi:carboxymethylenebutenolidase